MEALEQDLRQEYLLRFSALAPYRDRVWQVLTREYFQALVPADAAVLDLGSGWGEFIRNIRAGTRYAMDLNPESGPRAGSGVRFLHQDCSREWALPENSLDVVFTSNFFEHLPSKEALRATMDQALRCLKPGGRLICLGPNMRFLAGTYWDFWDHYLALSDRSLVEGLSLAGFRVERCIPKFLPFSMSQGFAPPVGLVSVYLRLPPLWDLFGKQFLVIGRKPAAGAAGR
jgi:SAM-dependent methyltransferase